MDITEVQHESITEENRAGLATHMEKFDSFEAAAVDGMALKKQTGHPYKFPESMDKLPDDTSREEFSTKARELLGIKPGVSHIDDLKDINMAAGMAEGGKADDNVSNMLKNFAVEKKMSASRVQELAEFYNGPLTEYAVRQMATRQEADSIAKATATNEALIAHPSIGSEKVLNEQSELLRRTIQNHAGLTAEEYETVGTEMADSILTKNPVVARAMLKLLAPMSATATNEGGDGNPPPKKVISDNDKKLNEIMNWQD